MVKIFVNDKQNSNVNISIYKHASPYSIMGHGEIVKLNDGCNEFENLPYGFSINNYSHSESIKRIDLSKYDTSNVTNMSKMFFGCVGLTSLDLTKFDTSNVTNMNGMFAICNNLTSLDLSSFKTSKVTDMSSMFYGCERLVRLDLSNFRIDSLDRISHMFIGCYNLFMIKCRREFMEMCLNNNHMVSLPTCLCKGGNGIWDIVK